MVLVSNDNDKNAGFVGGIGVGEVFRRSSDISPMKVAGGMVALNNGEVAIIGDSVGAVL